MHPKEQPNTHVFNKKKMYDIIIRTLLSEVY
jgi:hypothetical protein